MPSSKAPRRAGSATGRRKCTRGDGGGEEEEEEEGLGIVGEVKGWRRDVSGVDGNERQEHAIGLCVYSSIG